jgi:hypothetical protein
MRDVRYNENTQSRVCMKLALHIILPPVAEPVPSSFTVFIVSCAHSISRFCGIHRVSSMKMTALWDVAPYSLVVVGRRFRATYCPHHQSGVMMEAVRTTETSACFQETTRLYIPEISHLYTRCRENLRFHSVESVQNSCSPCLCSHGLWQTLVFYCWGHFVVCSLPVLSLTFNRKYLAVK